MFGVVESYWPSAVWSPWPSFLIRCMSYVAHGERVAYTVASYFMVGFGMFWIIKHKHKSSQISEKDIPTRGNCQRYAR